ncbi:MAG TPA: hypothetical protein VFN68_12375, partial [Acidimicrobiales bacterium]|nr:hypothetical protein [Acidimicrobiales bacterium]
YWLVASDGGIFSFGDAHFYGSTGSMRLNKPIVGMAADPATGGYWFVASDGGVFSFNAPFYGSTGSMRLNKPIVGMAAMPDGRGYWLVASDGGIFSFGDAAFHGSSGSIRLNKPIVGMAATQDGGGYWLVASDGGIFTFGDAAFHGSAGSIQLNRPIVGMAATPDSGGYWLVASDGGIFTYGDAPFLGTAGNATAPVVTIMPTAHGYPYPPGSTGYDVSKWQCGNLPRRATIGIVEVAGATNAYPNPCYQSEAAWAGSNLSTYIFMNELPSPAPSESMSGPAGNCSASDAACQSYNFGYYWARYWVSFAQGQGVDPTLWWLDVEQPSTFWASRSQNSNANVIWGAVAGLRSAGKMPGLYSTNLQWGQITGGAPTFQDIPLWVPGGGNISGGTYSANSICAGTAGSDYAAFAGGRIDLVQYGYSGNGYTGPYSAYDMDYACPG